MDSKDTYQTLGFLQDCSLAHSCMLYPLEQAKIQINICQDSEDKVLRILSQVKQTYNVSGLQGCYTGFIPWFAATVSYKYVFMGTRQVLQTNDVVKDIDLNDVSEYRRFRLFTHSLGQGIMYRTAAVVVSQPFHVVSVRMVAELFSKEIKYTDMISSLWMILKEEGLGGLFAGLFPRLLADLVFYISVSSVRYIIDRNLSSRLNTVWRDFIDLMFRFSLAIYCNPLLVISSRKAINK